MNKDDVVIANLVARNILPIEGSFDITVQLIDEFYDTYSRLYSTSDKNNKNSNVKYAKKLAGLSLLKLLKARSDIVSSIGPVSTRFSITAGFLYIVKNPSFPNHFKVGVTRDLKYRLNTYQTGDPHRGYEVDKYVFLEDVRKIETEIFEDFSDHIENGEWLRNSCYSKLVEDYFRV